jgi:hypothetical protein
MDYNREDLWSLHFPRLRSFTLVLLECEVPPEENELLDFILVHSNTIEVLDLGYGGNLYMFDGFPWVRLQTTSLPHLHSLRGHPSTLSFFAHARLNCLSTSLRRLAVGPGGASDMFDAVLSPDIGSGPAVGHLLALQEIELDLYELDETQWEVVVEIIQLCARCCPSLEVWRGTLPARFKIDAGLLSELFGLFQSLRVISLHEDSILGPEGLRTGREPESESEDEPDEAENESGNEVEEVEEMEETVHEQFIEDDTCDDFIVEAYVHMLALRCGALEKVTVQRSYSMKDWWTISRTSKPTVPGEEVVCSISRRTIEERDSERW